MKTSLLRSFFFLPLFPARFSSSTICFKMLKYYTNNMIVLIAHKSDVFAVSTFAFSSEYFGNSLLHQLSCFSTIFNCLLQVDMALLPKVAYSISQHYIQLYKFKINTFKNSRLSLQYTHITPIFTK